MSRIDVAYSYPWCLVGDTLLVTWKLDLVEQPYFVLPINVCPYEPAGDILARIPHTASDQIYINGSLYGVTHNVCASGVCAAVPGAVVNACLTPGAACSTTPPTSNNMAMIAMTVGLVLGYLYLKGRKKK